MDAATRGWKSDEDRGPVGAWFVRAIGERSIETVAKDMAARGHAHKPDYYRGIMSGSKKPGRTLLRALTEYLGSSPVDTKESAPLTGDALVAAAIDRQTEMLRTVLIALAGPTLTPELQAWAEEMHQALSTGSQPPRIPDGGKVR